MSTFGGKIQEIPYISVDRFDGENLESEVYFLSHCHTDHMKGINYYFWEHLINTKRFLYATPISCTILKQSYPTCENNIRELWVHTPLILTVQNHSLSITTIPAGHSPGSVMFLFMTESQNILYTGDFRINKNDIRKMKQFYNSFKQVIKIDKLYLDTTFFSKAYHKFPKRTESLEEICKAIHSHISQGKNYIIHLITGAYYGYEYVFQKIYKKFNMPVHVRYQEYEFYRTIPELDGSVTLDASSTQIHCQCRGYKTYCNAPGIVQTLKVTAWNWISELLEQGISRYDDDGTYCVCFSTHASFEEIVELIQFLKPKEIEVCVKSKTPEINEEMNSTINQLLREIHSPQKIVMEPRLFKTNLKAKKVKRYKSETSSSNQYLSSILDSPPRERRFLSDSSLPSKKVIPRSLSLGVTETINLLTETKLEKPVPVDCSLLENKRELHDPSTSVVSKENDEIVQSRQISLEELQISTEKQNGDILLSIIEDDNLTDDKKGNSEEVNVHVENNISGNNSGDVILSFLDSQEIIKNENIYNTPDENSQNVLLDIIDA